VQDAFDRWGPDLASTALTFSDGGGSLSGDGDVDTAAELIALEFNCADGLSPVVFDADGSLFAALGIPASVIGFASPECALGGTITEALAALNGNCFDGDAFDGCELSEAEFRGSITHEFGHWLNAGHTQVNGQFFLGDTNDAGFGAYGSPSLADVQLMFPFAFTGAATVPQSDDVAAMSALYPAAGWAAGVGVVTGRVLRSDGVTPFDGASVIARNTADPFGDVVSNVSGAPFLFAIAGPPAPGAYELAGVTSGADYSVEISSVNALFTEGSGVGPQPRTKLPGREEFYNAGDEAATDPPDDVTVWSDVTTAAGALTSGIDFVINLAAVPALTRLGLAAAAGLLIALAAPALGRR